MQPNFVDKAIKSNCN